MAFSGGLMQYINMPLAYEMAPRDQMEPLRLYLDRSVGSACVESKVLISNL